LATLPEEHQWRVQATKAIVACADGNASVCLQTFTDLEGIAPASGLNHAKTTAAVLLADKDTSGVGPLLVDVDGTPAAQAFWSAGKNNKARKVVEAGMFEKFLKGEM
jgi:hypothetical protein